MKKNIRIARELLRLAKMIAAADDNGTLAYVIENGSLPPGMTRSEFDGIVSGIVSGDPVATALMHEIRGLDASAGRFSGDAGRTAGVSDIVKSVFSLGGAKALALSALLSLEGYSEIMKNDPEIKPFLNTLPYEEKVEMTNSPARSYGTENTMRRVRKKNDTDNTPAAMQGRMDLAEAKSLTLKTIHELTLNQKEYRRCNLSDSAGATVVCVAVRIPVSGGAKQIFHPDEEDFKEVNDDTKTVCDSDMENALKELAENNGRDYNKMLKDRSILWITTGYDGSNGAFNADFKPRKPGEYKNIFQVRTAIVYGFHNGVIAPAGVEMAKGK